MKFAIPFSIVPIVVGFAACSSSSNTGTVTGPGTDAATNDASSGGAEAGVVDGGADASDATSDGANLTAPDATNDAGNDAGNAGDASDDTGDEDGNDTTPFAATLTGFQVIPPVTTSATGTGTFTLLADGVTLQYTVALTGLSGAPTGVNLHVGSAVDNAGISHQLPVTGTGVTTSGSTITLTGSVALLSEDPQDEVDGISEGLVYIDVLTAANPSGELRGQITSPGATVLVAHLAGDQEVPPVVSANAAAASFILSADGSTVQYHLSPAASLPATEISGISFGTAIGGEPIDLGGTTGLMTQTDASIGISDPTPWLNGEISLNIETAAHPTGELRGQVILPAETLFTSTLTLTPAAQANGSTTQGWAQVILDPTQTNVRYEVDTTSANLTGVFLDFGGFPGAGDAGAADGGVTHMDQLTIVGTNATNASATGGVGTPLALMGGDVPQLKAGTAWINVETMSYSSGELQGLLAQH